jgi:hypothetical protein
MTFSPAEIGSSEKTPNRCTREGRIDNLNFAQSSRIAALASASGPAISLASCSTWSARSSMASAFSNCARLKTVVPTVPWDAPLLEAPRFSQTAQRFVKETQVAKGHRHFRVFRPEKLVP